MQKSCRRKKGLSRIITSREKSRLGLGARSCHLTPGRWSRWGIRLVDQLTVSFRVLFLRLNPAAIRCDGGAAMRLCLGRGLSRRDTTFGPGSMAPGDRFVCGLARSHGVSRERFPVRGTSHRDQRNEQTKAPCRAWTDSLLPTGGRRRTSRAVPTRARGSGSQAGTHLLGATCTLPNFSTNFGHNTIQPLFPYGTQPFFYGLPNSICFSLSDRNNFKQFCVDLFMGLFGLFRWGNLNCEITFFIDVNWSCK